MDAFNGLSAPNIVLALIGASGAGIVLLVLMRRGWDVNLGRSASAIQDWSCRIGEPSTAKSLNDPQKRSSG